MPFVKFCLKSIDLFWEFLINTAKTVPRTNKIKILRVRFAGMVIYLTLSPSRLSCFKEMTHQSTAKISHARSQFDQNWKRERDLCQNKWK